MKEYDNIFISRFFFLYLIIEHKTYLILRNIVVITTQESSTYWTEGQSSRSMFTQVSLGTSGVEWPLLQSPVSVSTQASLGGPGLGLGLNGWTSSMVTQFSSGSGLGLPLSSSSMGIQASLGGPGNGLSSLSVSWVFSPSAEVELLTSCSPAFLSIIITQSLIVIQEPIRLSSLVRRFCRRINFLIFSKFKFKIQFKFQNLNFKISLIKDFLPISPSVAMKTLDTFQRN